nr:MAG TPA: hypothetical protein [Caudoviricetes sp.]
MAPVLSCRDFSPKTRTGAVPPAPVRLTLCGPTSSQILEVRSTNPNQPVDDSIHASK